MKIIDYTLLDSQMEEDLNIVVFISSEYEEFLNLMYIPTLPNDIEKVYLIRKDYQKMDKGLAGKTHNAFYKKIMKDRWHIYYDCIVQNKGKTILFTDVDIIFLRKFKDDLLHSLENYDMVWQSAREPAHASDLCGGFWAVKANDAVIEFMRDYYLPMIDEKPVELYEAGYPQVEMQDLLLRPEISSLINFSMLPLTYGYDVEDSYLYHAMGLPEQLMSRSGRLLTSMEIKFIACWQTFINRAKQEELHIDKDKIASINQKMIEL